MYYAFVDSGSSRILSNIFMLSSGGVKASFLSALSYSQLSGLGSNASDSSYPTMMFFYNLLVKSRSENEIAFTKPLSAFSVRDTIIIYDVIKVVKAKNLS